MPLAEVNLFGTRVSDLTPLAGAPLRMLWLNETPVESIAALRGAPLVSLTLHKTRVRDLSPLEGSRIQRLHVGETPVDDLSPLAKLNLTRLIFTPAKIKSGIEGIRAMASLRELDIVFDDPNQRKPMPPEVFWRRFDAGEFAKP